MNIILYYAYITIEIILKQLVTSGSVITAYIRVHFQVATQNVK